MFTPAVTAHRPAQPAQPMAPVQRAARSVTAALRDSVARRPAPRSDLPIDRVLRRVTFAVSALVGAIWLVVLVRRSHGQWLDANLGLDFAIFHQPFHLIAHGDLAPQSTVVDAPYVRSHFELIMWLVAPLWWVTRSGEMLLHIQNAATVGCALAVVRWTCALGGAALAATPQAGRLERVARLCVLPLTGLLILMHSARLADAALEDFHFQALATFFVVMAGSELSLGRRRGFLWVVLALLCGDVAGTYVVGLGISVAILARGRRIWGAYLIAGGLLWVLALARLHFNLGTPEDAFRYLTDEPAGIGPVSLVAVGISIVLHPTRPWRMIHSRWSRVTAQLAGTGGLGVLHPWALPICAIVLGANNLALNESFSAASFQAVPVYVFSAAGLVMLLDLGASLPRRVPGTAQRAAAAIGVLALSATLVAASLLWRWDGPSHREQYQVPAAAAGELNHAAGLIQPSDHVVATFGVAGRFAGRAQIDVVSRPGLVFVFEPGRRAVVIAAYVGNVGVPVPCLQALSDWAAGQSGARTLADTPAVQVRSFVPQTRVEFAIPETCAS